MPKKEEDFAEWYNEVVETAGLCDKRYPIKGMNIWTPYGWRIMRLIDGFIHAEMERTGHQEVYFPMLIPEDQFAKEADHIKGFGDDVYWVTHAGQNPLDVRLLLRPTSETAMYPIFALWVRSHADLPLKVYQIVNVFRYETKQTRAFMRVREIHFFEAHTCHADFEDAERQIAEDLEIMERTARKLCLPYLCSKRPHWDKFAGAYYSIGVDAVMPNGRTLQIGGIHQYRENFAKPYGIMYEAEGGEHRYAHQTTYGMSERLLGTVVGLHGDDRGIKLPPEIAPIQAVVVPIPMRGEQDRVMSSARALAVELADAGFRAHLDERDLRPGNKYYDWEMRGVPVRLELGPKDLDKDQVMAVRRDTMEKVPLPRQGIVEGLRTLLDAVQADMLAKAESEMRAMIRTVSSYDEARDWPHLIRCGWCGDDRCADQMERELDRGFLGTPARPETFEGQCLECGKPTTTVVYMAKSY